MKKNLLLALFISFIAVFSASAVQKKKAISHDDYAKWNSVEQTQISQNGEWISYQICPQVGDTTLIISNPEDDFETSIHRGKNAKISGDAEVMVFKIQEWRDTIRSLRLKKTKKDKLPKDSMGVYLTSDKKLLKFPRVKSYKLAEENSNWVYYMNEKPLPPKKDTTKADTTEVKEEAKNVEAEETAENTAQEKTDTTKTEKKKEIKKEGLELIAFNPLKEKTISFENVESYTISNKANKMAYLSKWTDSLDTMAVYVYIPGKEEAMEIFKKQGEVKKLVMDNTGKNIAFLFSADTNKKDKVYELYFWQDGKNSAEIIVDSKTKGMNMGWTVSEHGSLRFSDNSTRLFLANREIPTQEPEDTLLPEEKYKLDLWHWKDKRLQPHQLKELKKDKNRAFTAVYHIADKKMVQLEDETCIDLNTDPLLNADYFLGRNPQPYQEMITWEYPEFTDYYRVNVKTGFKELIIKAQQYHAELSPDGKYFVYFDEKDRSWNSIEVSTKKVTKLIKSDGKINFHDEELDIPMEAPSLGLATWTKDSKYFFAYDKYDIWQIDPSGKAKAKNVTKEIGRKENIQFRYQVLDRKDKEISLDQDILLRAFNKENKDAGYYKLNIEDKDIEKLAMTANSYMFMGKAKKSDKVIWRCGNYNNYPDLFYSSIDFDDAKRVSDANPQSKDYLWGTVELIKWTDLEGIERTGLLYKPENFDAKKKYPMLVYFYEKYTDDIHRHYVPKPTASIIYPSLYASNDYLVFIPDIHYGTGHPGQDAYNAIMSGTLHLINQGFVNKEKMGLQGQSWGGYQTAIMVTKTNLFAAAMAGAPVSNMTSAYGGIRWGTGLNRAFQYEVTQSRLGATLWEKPELYIENSPLFFADRVETPLMIMHNDNDGAVPWYQGIELFTALRRLNKPVWMLNYNGDKHNLMQRANRLDLSIRMMQFFDHYLKDAPAPLWLEEGIPAVKKGETDAYEPVRK